MMCHTSFATKHKPKYNEYVADLLGRMNESLNADLYSNPGGLNMDLWNNAVGRKYGKKTKNRKELLNRIHKALKEGELVVNPDDPRKYKGASHRATKSRPIVVLKEENGRNEVFYDTAKNIILTREQLIALIEGGQYRGYTIKNIKGAPTPVSNPDGRKTNNLGNQGSKQGAFRAKSCLETK